MRNLPAAVPTMTDPSSSALSSLTERREFRWFMLLALLLIGIGIGLRDPWPSDEPRFALVAKQMVESGDWLFPHRGTELYSDKPPMLFWMQAATYEVVRNWRIAFLLPSLLSGLLTLALVYDLGRRWWSHRAGLYAATALLFAFQFLYQAKRAQIDPLVLGFITLANWGLLRHFIGGPNWRAYWLGCFAAGVGVITKGVGVLAWLMFVPYLFALWRGWDGVTRTSHSTLRWLGGIAAFVLPVLAWAVPLVLVAHARGGAEYQAYINDLFFRQTAGRYAKSWDHAQPFWYFVPIVLFSWFPLSLAYFGAVPRWWRDLKLGEARVMLPLVWSLLLFVFFSIPSGKRDVYLMPALPMVALAMAPYLAEIAAARWLRVAAFAIAVGAGVALLAIGLWAMSGHSARFDAMLQKRGLDAAGDAVRGMLVLMGAVFLASAAWFRVRRGALALLGGFAGLWIVWSLWAYPTLNDASSAAGVMRKAREVAGSETTIGLVAWKEQNLLMASGPVQDFGFVKLWPQQYAEAAQWLAQAPETRRLFILQDAMGACVDRDKATRIGRANRRDWWLAGNDAIVPGCVPEDGLDVDDEP